MTGVVMALQLSTGEPDAEKDAEDTAVFVGGTAVNVGQAAANAVPRIIGQENGTPAAPAPRPPGSAPVTAQDPNGDGVPG